MALCATAHSVMECMVNMEICSGPDSNIRLILDGTSRSDMAQAVVWSFELRRLYSIPARMRA